MESSPSARKPSSLEPRSAPARGAPATGVARDGGGQPASATTCLRVLSLNVAHGRGTAFHQAFTRAARVRDNLDAVAELILESEADAVALQEIDAASSWSGNFDHLEYLATRTGFDHSYHGLHVERRYPRLAYGTGVLSRYPISLGYTYRFGQNALDTKGFVYTHVDAPGAQLSLVSVHLDFKRTRERRAQLDALSECLEGDEIDHDGRHLVIAGDFNCSLRDRNPILQGFLERHGLGWGGTILPTFPSSRPWRLIDYVFVSGGLEVQREQTIPVRVSDHLPVLAEIAPVRREGAEA